MTTIINYGMGNIGSIINIFQRMGVDVNVSSNPKDILNSKKLILPGVGSFDKGMKNLETYGLIESLHEAVLDNKTPILGICLGMQLFTAKSEEGEARGLGWVDADTVKFQIDKVKYKYLKIPHMGWNSMNAINDSPLTSGITSEDQFYFVHSYHVTNIEKEHVIACTQYGNIIFPSIIQQENIFGIQPHPERSHRKGLTILNNFLRINNV